MFDSQWGRCVHSKIRKRNYKVEMKNSFTGNTLKFFFYAMKYIYFGWRTGRIFNMLHLKCNGVYKRRVGRVDRGLEA
jgi:hypothetical protein